MPCSSTCLLNVVYDEVNNMLKGCSVTCWQQVDYAAQGFFYCPIEKEEKGQKAFESVSKLTIQFYTNHDTVTQ